MQNKGKLDGSFIILDTNILLNTRDINSLLESFSEAEDIFITIGVIKELDRLKTLDGDKGFKARRSIKQLELAIKSQAVKVLSGDNISVDAIDSTTVDGSLIKHCEGKENHILATNDLSLSLLALSKGVPVVKYEGDKSIKQYGVGYKTYDWSPYLGNNYKLHFSEAIALADRLINKEDLCNGEYAVILKDENVAVVLKKTKIGFIQPKGEKKFSSGLLGSYSPKDLSQVLAFDMLGRQNISLLTGGAGSGKTLLCLAKQFDMMEKGEIDKITIFTNPEKVLGAKSLGYYKGDRTSKLLQESIGSILASKIGGALLLEKLIEEEKIVILPISDIRGYEIPNNSSLYITEAQNMNVEMMKLALQRASENTKIFIEGDPFTQLDSWRYEDENNGMLSLIEAFRDTGLLGYIHLNKIHRSSVANVAERMK